MSLIDIRPERDPYLRETQYIDASSWDDEHIPSWEIRAVEAFMGLTSGQWWNNPGITQMRHGLWRLAGADPQAFRQLEEVLGKTLELMEG